ncbi:MAG: hypothetical protein C4570_07795 [Ammonifex sp.]|nr:MAG: hypothetical protein C4570_07795 [Ammonifex sp.]
MAKPGPRTPGRPLTKGGPRLGVQIYVPMDVLVITDEAVAAEKEKDPDASRSKWIAEAVIQRHKKEGRM